MNWMAAVLAAVREPFLARALMTFRQEVERERPRLAWAFLVRDGTLWRSYFCRVGAGAGAEVGRALQECAGAPADAPWQALPGPHGRQTPRAAFAVHDQAALALTRDDAGLRDAFTLLLLHFRERDNAGNTDHLTGLVNRRGFDEALRQTFLLQQRHRSPFAVGLLDLDHFKEYNDREGHARGDACLVAAAAGLRKVLRESDTLARHGGDEFALILPYVEPAGLEAVARRIAGAFPAGNGLNACCGLVCVPAQHPLPAPAALLRRADEELYRAKAAGPGSVRAAIWTGA